MRRLRLPAAYSWGAALGPGSAVPETVGAVSWKSPPFSDAPEDRERSFRYPIRRKKETNLTECRGKCRGSVLAPEDDVAGLGGLDDGQGLQVHTRGPQPVAAALESLFYRAADAHQRGTGGVDDVAQAPHGFAVGHEVVDNQDLVVGGEPLLGQEKMSL